MVSKTDMLGGDLFPVSYRNAASVDTTVPAEFFADWMNVYAAKYNAYTEYTKVYLDKVDKYNYFAAGKAWTAAWIAKNVGTSIDVAVTQPYTDALRKATVDGAEILIAPEKPMVPILPAAYDGPSIHTGAGTQAINTFTLLGGMGKPVIGKLGFNAVAGLGHSFGVKGQGNEAKDNSSSDTAKNLVYPKQSVYDYACKSSYLYVIVTGTSL
jgi:hypothetical protein